MRSANRHDDKSGRAAERGTDGIPHPALRKLLSTTKQDVVVAASPEASVSAD
jgi:hypothetical protein